VPPRGPHYRGARQQARSTVRQHQALELYLRSGMSYSAVAAELGVTRQTVHVLVRRALERLAEDTQDLARVWLQRQLLQHQLVLGAAWAIVEKPCGMCSGTCEVTREEYPGDWVGMNEDGTPVYTPVGAPCPRCDSTGYHYGYQARMQAMDRHERACGHVARLLGLYAPERHDHTHRLGTWREELAALADEEIDTMLLEYARDAHAVVDSTAQRVGLPPAEEA
jgi:DNA-binding CsgD family transcriptional regulator